MAYGRNGLPLRKVHRVIYGEEWGVAYGYGEEWGVAYGEEWGVAYGRNGLVREFLERIDTRRRNAPGDIWGKWGV